MNADSQGRKERENDDRDLAVSVFVIHSAFAFCAERWHTFGPSDEKSMPMSGKEPIVALGLDCSNPCPASLATLAIR